MPESQHQDAAQLVAAYHEAQLSSLLGHVDEALSRLRAGEAGPFDVDQDLFQYSRAAKELWKFCSLGNVVETARMIEDFPAGGLVGAGHFPPTDLSP